MIGDRVKTFLHWDIYIVEACKDFFMSPFIIAYMKLHMVVEIILYEHVNDYIIC